ncbi:MAG TPA: hypothetical protein PLH53_16130, partial [Ignavibacteriaceae bacterium]|nr:hypothetical protein [Ignavibacteriaceae bacterium]
MKIFKLILLLTFLFLFDTTFSQVENVPIANSVYTFLKEMKVKGILAFIREDDPVLSRFEVKHLLEKVNNQITELSATEKKLLNKYLTEFSDTIDPDSSTQLFNPQNGFFTDL